MAGQLEQEDARKPQKQKEAHRVGNEREQDAGAVCGVAPAGVQRERHGDTGERRDDEIQYDGTAHDDAEREIRVERDGAESNDKAPHDSVEQADGELLVKDAAVPRRPGCDRGQDRG